MPAYSGSRRGFIGSGTYVRGKDGKERVIPRSVPRAIQKKKRPTVNPKVAFKLTKPMKALVTAVVDANKQDHWVRSTYRWTGLQYVPHTNPGGGFTGLFQVIPKVTQAGQPDGAGGITPNTIESREGNQIQLKSIVCNINLVMSSTYSITDSAHAGIRYRIVIMSSKKYADYDDFTDNWFDTAGSDHLETQFLRDGDAAVPWDAEMENFDLPVNSELFTVHAQRTGKLNRGTAYGDTSGSSAVMKQANVTLKIPLKVKSKKLLYSQPDESVATNFNPVIWIGYKTYDGTSLHSGNFVHVVGNSTIRFDDIS